MKYKIEFVEEASVLDTCEVIIEAESTEELYNKIKNREFTTYLVTKRQTISRDLLEDEIKILDKND